MAGALRRGADLQAPRVARGTRRPVRHRASSVPPVVSIHMFAGLQRLNGRVPVVRRGGAVARPDLSVLLAKVLLMFTIDFERDSNLSLPTSANSLRVLDETGVRVRDLPRLTGVSKEAIAMSVGLLSRLGCVVVEPDPTASRGKVVRLTAK